jgi:hypothetical protein
MAFGISSISSVSGGLCAVWQAGEWVQWFEQEGQQQQQQSRSRCNQATAAAAAAAAVLMASCEWRGCSMDLAVCNTSSSTGSSSDGVRQ